jgi:hypothetical protein
MKQSTRHGRWRSGSSRGHNFGIPGNLWRFSLVLGGRLGDWQVMPWLGSQRTWTWTGCSLSEAIIFYGLPLPWRGIERMGKTYYRRLWNGFYAIGVVSMGILRAICAGFCTTSLQTAGDVGNTRAEAAPLPPPRDRCRRQLPPWLTGSDIGG